MRKLTKKDLLIVAICILSVILFIFILNKSKSPENPIVENTVQQSEDKPWIGEEDLKPNYKLEGIEQEDAEKYIPVTNLLNKYHEMDEDTFTAELGKLDSILTKKSKQMIAQEYDAFQQAMGVEVEHGQDDPNELDYTLGDDYAWPLFSKEGERLGETTDINEYIKHQKDEFGIIENADELTGKVKPVETQEEEYEEVETENILLSVESNASNMITISYKQSPTNDLLVYELFLTSDMLVEDYRLAM